MKIKVLGGFCYFENFIFFNEDKRKIVKFNFVENKREEYFLNSDFTNLKLLKSDMLLINNHLLSIILNFDFKVEGYFAFGTNAKSDFYNDLIFTNSTIKFETEYIFNWIINKNSKKYIQLLITEVIKFYEFHDEYFIPVTYMNAAQGHSYGPELSVYNYHGELVWSKDFRKPDTYIDSEPIFHDELFVNSNIKICDDYVVVSTSTNHLFCYYIHTGKQIWYQNQFEGPFPNPQMVALDTEQKMIYVWMYMTFHKIDLLTGQIILSKDMWEWHDRFRHGYVSWTVTKDGLWSATQNHGVVACINKYTLDIDKTYQLESHGVINDSAAPHVTDEFIVIPDGLGNLEVIKR
jgi:hypothetical protein